MDRLTGKLTLGRGDIAEGKLNELFCCCGTKFDI